MGLSRNGGGTTMKKVTRDGWCVSTETGTGINGVRLSVFKVINNNPYKIRYGDHHGRMFSTQEEADKFTLERGYCKTFSRVDRFGPLLNNNQVFIKMHFEAGMRLGQRRKDAA